MNYIDRLQDELKIENFGNIPSRLPVLPMRDTVVLPYMLFPILVGREQSIRAVELASKASKYILLLPQKSGLVESPKRNDLYKVGTAAKILQKVQLPNGLMKVLVDGVVQAFVRKFSDVDGVLYANFQTNFLKEKKSNELEAHVKHASQLFREYIEYNEDIPPETWMTFDSIQEIDKRLYYAVAHLDLPLAEKVALYEFKNLKAQYSELTKILLKEVNVLKIKREIDEKVQGSIQKNQRKYYLQEQLRIMQDELGEDGDLGEYGILREKIVKAKMPEQVKAKAFEELDRLKRTQLYSPESTVARNYLEWLVSVPWFKKTVDNIDIEHARRILNEYHYGLDKPKERIVEQIAVLSLVKEMHSQILCFVGPPGVGKTSLAKSIARALGRQFVRISLGGMRDEAEIRGHRRTYVGSLPGRIIQAMKKAGVVNPVILLDEIDKMTLDFHGDPASALLEVLDPEQNHAFQDHYLEVDYDLSRVLFITTANLRDDIPAALLDRMEIIELPGYLDYDKLEIARKHIIPKQLKAHGMKGVDVIFEDEAILKIIREYTWEAGVRDLERSIAAICRKIATDLVTTKSVSQQIIVNEKKVEKSLGIPKFSTKLLHKESRVGVANGLAWTSGGGDILNVEVLVIKGATKLVMTGRLGTVMQESAQAALSYLRANSKRFGLSGDFFKGQEIHIHLPEGATPKDGPSAGITIVIAILSALSGRPVKGDVAMTGEINLSGDVLPVGGLNEKFLAAKRYRIAKVLIPGENLKDLTEMPSAVKDGIEIVPLRKIEDAFEHVFDYGLNRGQVS